MLAGACAVDAAALKSAGVILADVSKFGCVASETVVGLVKLEKVETKS